MRGWIGYFGISEYYKPIPLLDQWIRRRVRMCYWKMWKKAQRRFRELLKLNVNVRQIKMVVSSRKAYWCRSEAEAIFANAKKGAEGEWSPWRAHWPPTWAWATSGSQSKG